MYLCRATLQRFSPLARHAILNRDVVPRRLMSTVPGGTGQNLIYFVLCGGAFAGAAFYAYRTVTTDSARFSDRISEIGHRPKTEWKPKEWPPKNADEAEEVVEVEAEAPAEEPVALVAEATKKEPESPVETAAEVVAEVAETVAEAASVVEATAEEVAAVAHEVEKIAEEVEAAAKELETPALPVVEEASGESDGTEATLQEEAVTESANTQA